MSIKVTVVSPSKNRISINKSSNKLEYLKKLLDVDASDSDNNETLVYDETSGKFIVKTLPIVDGGIF